MIVNRVWTCRKDEEKTLGEENRMQGERDKVQRHIRRWIDSKGALEARVMSV